MTGQQPGEAVRSLALPWSRIVDLDDAHHPVCVPAGASIGTGRTPIGGRCAQTADEDAAASYLGCVGHCLFLIVRDFPDYRIDTVYLYQTF